MALPPLNSFRVFESVARLGSLTGAAVELHVTPGAVSQQIKSLQGALGVDLFEKRGRHLFLTPTGRAFYQRVSLSLDEIYDAVSTVKLSSRETQAPITLTLSIPPAEGVTWLASPLFNFLDQARGIKLDVRSATYFNQIDWRKVDVAVVYGTPPWSGFWWRLLHGIRLTPVCSPQFLRGPRAIRSVEDLEKHRLLHEDDGAQWHQWLAEAGSSHLHFSDVYFQDFGMVLQAARDGFGIALSDEVVSARDLNEGRLVQPLPLSTAAVHNYYCVCAEATRDRPEAVAVIEWLLSTPH